MIRVVILGCSLAVALPAQDVEAALRTARAGLERAATLADLRGAIAVLEQASGAVATDARLREQHGDLARRSLFCLHTLLLQGAIPIDEQAAAALGGVEAALERTGGRTPSLVIATESIRALLGDWQRALHALREVARDTPDRATAMLQMLQICQQYRSLEHGWSLFAEFERDLRASATPEQNASYLRLRCSLLTLVGLLDDAAEALAEVIALREHPDPTRRPRVDARLDVLLACSEMDLRLAAGRYDDAARLAARVIAMPGAGDGDRNRAQLGAALAALRRGDDVAASPALRTLASRRDVYGQRANCELAMLELRANERLRARERLLHLPHKPRAALLDSELLALAWSCLADTAVGAPALVPLSEMERALASAWEWQLRQWEQVPPRVSGVPFLYLPARRDLLSALCAVTLRSGGESAVGRCLDYLLAAEAMGSIARARGLPRAQLTAIRGDVIPARGALLVYLPAPTASWAFVATASRMTAFPLPSDHTLRAHVQALREVVLQPPAVDWRERLDADAAPLLAWAMPPALRGALADCDEIAIVGRELTAGLPFEGLPWDGGWLGCVRSIWDEPSMTLAALAGRTPRIARRHEVAVLAATRVAEQDGSRFGVGPIDLTSARLAMIAGDRAGAALLPAATRDDVLVGPGANAELAVVLAHGVLAPERLRPFGCLLDRGAGGTSGAVFADDIVAASDIVLLGSCGLGGGGWRRGEDGGHRIGGALLAAGARAVVVGDGDLELDATVHWAEVFAGALRRGATVAAAARAARAATSMRPGWEHPWFHGQLRVEGRGDERLARGSR